MHKSGFSTVRKYFAAQLSRTHCFGCEFKYDLLKLGVMFSWSRAVMYVDRLGMRVLFLGAGHQTLNAHYDVVLHTHASEIVLCERTM